MFIAIILFLLFGFETVSCFVFEAGLDLLCGPGCIHNPAASAFLNGEFTGMSHCT